MLFYRTINKIAQDIFFVLFVYNFMLHSNPVHSKCVFEGSRFYNYIGKTLTGNENAIMIAYQITLVRNLVFLIRQVIERESILED